MDHRGLGGWMEATGLVSTPVLDGNIQGMVPLKDDDGWAGGQSYHIRCWLVPVGRGPGSGSHGATPVLSKYIIDDPLHLTSS